MEILNKQEIDKIINYILQGKIVAIPTDTIYGFSCLATNNEVLNKLCKLKNRDEEKCFILLVSSKYDLSKLIDINENIDKFIKKHTPANLTMIVNKNKNMKLADVFNLDTYAIRIPDNKFLQEILDKVGFMVSTSCNLQGEPFLNDYNEIIEKFPSIDAIVVDSIKADNKPSTIVDLSFGEPVVIRQGEYII